MYLLSEVIFIWTIEMLLCGSLLSKNSDGVKYFKFIVSLINSSVSKFCPAFYLTLTEWKNYDLSNRNPKEESFVSQGRDNYCLASKMAVC